MLIQDFVHNLEQAFASRYFKVTVILLAALLLGVAYDFRDYRNMAAPEAMDSAQLARNIAAGEGYTTRFIRPFSIYLVKKVNQQKAGGATVKGLRDDARLRSPHPDVSNPPVYPTVLAGLMKVLPFNYSATEDKTFFCPGGTFQRYEPDFVIALFNQVLFLAIVVLMYWWTRRVFDKGVAWTAAILLLLMEVFWRFSISGLSTMLLLLIFTGLVWCLTLLESEAREPKHAKWFLPALTVAAGLLVGVGGLTTYAFGWMMIPVVVFLILFSGSRRVVYCISAIAAFLLVMAPWVARNYKVSGEPFGTATFAMVEDTLFFPKDRLERSLEPDFSHVDAVTPFRVKLLSNARAILITQIPNLSDSWLTAFFLVGLMIGFQNPALRRMRYFLLLSIAVLIVVQAMGRTELSDETPEINSENLIVLLLPLMAVYGVAFFYVLLDQINLEESPPLRFAIIVLFCIIISLPMEAALVNKVNPVSYPPYYPPQIEAASGFLQENELMMSDIPWAVAWYGRRQCVWLTLNATKDPDDPKSGETFFAINDFLKPINELYLTPKTMDAHFLTDWYRARQVSWGSFILDTLLRREVPPTFPVYQMPPGYAPDAILLQDRKRWQ